MKRTWILAALFLLLAAAAYFALRQKQTQTGSRVSWDMDFAVPNTENITKIFLADRRGRTVTLERKEDHWLYNGRFKARPTAVQTLLETMKQVNVLYIPPRKAEDAMIKSLAADGIKVEIYGKDGKKIKSYYVGGVTNNEQGTYMIMENAEQPYVVHVPAFVGQLRVRYMMGEDDWRDRTVFAEKPEAILSISVEYPQRKSESFRLEKTDKASYEVKPFFSTTAPSPSPQRKGAAEAYLLQYENLGAEAHETTNPLRDSVTALVPFAIVTVLREDSTRKTARFWPVSLEKRAGTEETYVIRYFTDLNDGEAFLLTQDQVFGPIFRGYRYFFERSGQSGLRN